MKDITESVARAPSVPGRCAGPTNPFLPFAKEEIEQSIPDRFEQQVARYPDRIAVRTSACTLTYSELNSAANRLASILLDQLGRTKDPIALLFDNGVPFVSASIASMKAGMIQVPLESTFPKARLRYILEQSQARVVVTDDANISLARELGSLPVINADRLEGRPSSANPGLQLTPDANVAIGYTSGSTGQPKGILWNHRGVLHAVMRHTNTYRVCAADRLVMFRATLRSSLYALLNGATYLPVSLRGSNPADLASWLMQEEVTIYRAAVSVFRSLACGLGTIVFPHMRLILLFGEAAYPTDAELYTKHFTDEAILGISLGCNEFDDYACFFVDKDTALPNGAIPAGYPIADTDISIVDEQGCAVGTDQVGEIVIRSRYNAVGYWRRPDLTQAAFVLDAGNPDERSYYTGDLGRRAADGCLFHHGRKDFQVKIRGNRVNVSETEAALLEIEGVDEAVVVGRERSPGDTTLVGYIVGDAAETPQVSELRRHLGERLPDYMVPSSFVFLDAMPLTATGKVDRRALPPPEGIRPAIDASFVAARSSLEQQLAAIWAEVLGLDRVGVNDGFRELGGDSLLAMQVAARVIAQWRLDLPLHTLLEASTVADMADRIVAAANTNDLVDASDALRGRARHAQAVAGES
jgi:amino acid adenylation domain-containing protein